MKIPKSFLPEKGLEEKINQLGEEPKINKNNPEKKPYAEELELLLSEFKPAWTDYDTVYCKVELLAEKAGYTKTKHTPMCDYWVKPADFGGKYVLASFGKRFQKHYIFAMMKEDKVKKFCKRLEYQRRMVYPKTLLLAGSVISLSLPLSYACSSFPAGNFLKDMVSWVLPSFIAMPALLSIPHVARYFRKRIGKGLEKYCTGLILNDDKKAVEAAFS